MNVGGNTQKHNIPKHTISVTFFIHSFTVVFVCLSWGVCIFVVVVLGFICIGLILFRTVDVVWSRVFSSRDHRSIDLPVTVYLWPGICKSLVSFSKGVTF